MTYLAAHPTPDNMINSWGLAEADTNYSYSAGIESSPWSSHEFISVQEILPLEGHLIRHIMLANVKLRFFLRLPYSVK